MHVGIEGKELADKFAKSSLNMEHIEIDISISKTEAKSIIKKALIKSWQNIWGKEKFDRHLYSIQRQVGIWNNETGLNRREDSVQETSNKNLTCACRIGNLYKIKKHPCGLCRYSGLYETVEHVLLHYRAYNNERLTLDTKVKKRRCEQHVFRVG